MVYGGNATTVCPATGTTMLWGSLMATTTVPYWQPPITIDPVSVACSVEITFGPNCKTYGWVSGCRHIDQVTLIPNVGSVSAPTDSICQFADPEPITYNALPSGADYFEYQWYYQPGITCENINELDFTGWYPIYGANSPTYDPPPGLNQSRIYKCAVKAVDNPCQTNFSWSQGCHIVIVTPNTTATYGTIQQNNQQLCTNANPSLISFSSLPTGGAFVYQWYYQNGIVAAPTGSSTAGWTIINGANNNTYNPPPGLTLSRTYACFLSPINSQTCFVQSIWAGGCSQGYHYR
ncbi:MAG: hypothetical protein M0D57_08670 [Sphingobacteriales bacterium JAD_PAG50586_3]|nr:MAG: hypothetical protein M0D57_08670 [Sphingobacteriales bacterium JAD_PAG50586_3]